MFKYVVSVLLLLVALFVLSFASEEVQQKNVVQDLNKAPGFSLQNYEGETVTLDDFEGQFVVLNSWASWCAFCVKELSEFAQVQSEFYDQDVRFVAINRGESLEKAQQFSDQLHVGDQMALLVDPGDSFYQSVGGFSMPETVFVNQLGEIFFHKRGVMSYQETVRRVQELLDASK